MSIEFLLATFVVVIAPGTGVLYTLATGLSGGGRASIAAAFGCTLGIVPSITACILGISALLHAGAMAFLILKYAGAAYLIYLAIQTLRDLRNPALSQGDKTQRYWQIIRKGFLLNILNPKLSIFFLAFLPQFLPVGIQNPSMAIAELGAIFMAATFVIFIGYGLAASAIRTKILSKPIIFTWIRYSIAGTFAALGLKLAVSER